MEQKLIRTGRVLNLYKQLGETPLERLDRLRVQRDEYKGEVLSYAGRLDPMAEGVLICLVGSANKMRETYLEMTKEYTLDLLFGFSTDTYDVLGRVLEQGDDSKVTKDGIKRELNEFRGKVSQEYPPYSSKTVEGTSLFSWARSGMLGSIVVPSRSVTIYDITLQGCYKISEAALLSYIEASVQKVQGDFRQESVLADWKKVLPAKGEKLFKCATVSISCSSGTYARSIAHSLGQRLGCPALALHILRTKVGEYSVERSLK